MITAITSPDATRAWTYGYDGLDRLILADNANGAADDRAYAYDGTDNLIYNSGLCAGSAASPNLVYPPIPPPPAPPPPPAIVNLTDTYFGQMAVTMSSVKSGNVGSNALDNNTATRAQTNGNANEWLKLDMGAEYEVTRVQLALPGSNGASTTTPNVRTQNWDTGHQRPSQSHQNQLLSTRRHSCNNLPLRLVQNIGQAMSDHHDVVDHLIDIIHTSGRQ